MAYIPDVSGLVAGMFDNSALVKALQQLQAAAPQQPAQAAAPAAVTPQQQAGIAALQAALAGPNGGLNPIQSGSINEKNGDVTSATGAYRSLDPSQAFASGGIMTGNTIDASKLTGLPLEALTPDNGKGLGAGYQAITDQGDVAAQFNATPGENVRLIDPSTGDVIAQGVGSQGADEIASLASAVSQKMGKQAAWDVDVETAPGSNQYNTMYGDRVDKPRFTLLSAIEDILPAAASLLLPELAPALAPMLAGATGLSTAAATGLEAGAAGGLAGLATGQSGISSLLDAVGGGLGAGFGAAGAGAAGAGGATDFGAGIGNALGGINPAAATFDASALGGGSVGDLAGGGLGALGGGLGGLASGGFDAATSGLAGGNTVGTGAAGTVAPGAVNTADLGNTVGEVTVMGQPGGSVAGLTTAPGVGVAGGAIGSGLNTSTNPDTGSTYTPDGTISQEITVNGTPPATGPTINPAQIVSNIPGLIPTSDYAPAPQNLDTSTNNNSSLGKDLQQGVNLLKTLLGRGGGGGTSPSSSPSGVTPMSPETSPSPTNGGGPTGGGPSSPNSPIPGVTGTPNGGGLGTPATAGAGPLNVGAGTGGASGVGASGPGDLKLQGSLAPNVYPWVTPKQGQGSNPTGSGQQQQQSETSQGL